MGEGREWAGALSAKPTPMPTPPCQSLCFWGERMSWGHFSETTSPGSFLTGSQRQEATSEWAQDSFPPGLPCSELGSLPTPALAQWFFPPASILILTTTGFLQLVKKFLGLVPRYSNSLCFWGPGHEYSVNYLNTQLGKGSPTIPLTLPSSLTRLPNMCFVSWHKRCDFGQ